MRLGPRHQGEDSVWEWKGRETIAALGKEENEVLIEERMRYSPGEEE